MNQIGIGMGFAPVRRDNHLPPFSDGGIVEQPRTKPLPGVVLEERPAFIDPKTGEKVYLDEWIKGQNDRGKFLNTIA